MVVGAELHVNWTWDVIIPVMPIKRSARHREWYTLREIEKITKMPYSTMLDAIRSGRLPVAEMYGAQTHLVHYRDFNKWEHDRLGKYAMGLQPA